MKKHIRTLSVVPLAALAVSVCALYPTKTEIFTREPIDYKNAAVRLTAPSEPDTSAENITDPKSAILDKVLNTIDRLDRVYMTARTNMIGDGETTLTFDVDISAGLSHQSVAENGVTVSETYSDTNMGMVSIDHRTNDTHRTVCRCTPGATRRTSRLTSGSRMRTEYPATATGETSRTARSRPIVSSRRS